MKQDSKLQKNLKLVYNPKFPPLKRETNSEFTPQPSKLGQVKWLREDISQLVMCVHVNQVNVTLLIVISQEMEPHLDMLGLRM